MPFIIDRNMLHAINRRATAILRGQDPNALASDSGEWPEPRIEFTREEIRAAMMIAKKRNGASDDAATPNTEAPTSNDVGQ